MQRVFAIGDIHGCAHTLDNLLHQEIGLNKKDHVFFLGDYIDRGKRSKEVLDIIIGLQNKKYGISCLMGNHEQVFVDSSADDVLLETWLQNFGGLATMLSFNITTFDQLESKYKRFFSKLGIYALVDDFIIVHAGLNFSKEDCLEDMDAMLWERSTKIDKTKLGQRFVLHGHTPQTVQHTELQLKNIECDRILNIDNGCIFNTMEGMGNMTAFDIRSRTIFSTPNID